MKTDAHMHSSFSYDAEVCPKKMIEASIQKGLKAICFTDHYDKDDDQWGEGEQIFDVDEYFTTMTRLREQYRDQIEVRIGLNLVSDRILQNITAGSFQSIHLIW